MFLKNSIVNNNAKNESWKSNSRRGIIQWLKVVIYVQPHYSLNTPTQKNKLFVLKITIASWGAVIITSFSFSFFRSGFVSGLFIPKFLFFSQNIYIKKKKKQLNITFVFLKNSIVNNNAKNESWKSNSRRGIIQNKECKGLVFSHFRLFLLSPLHDFPPFIGQRPFRRTCGWFFSACFPLRAFVRFHLLFVTFSVFSLRLSSLRQ